MSDVSGLAGALSQYGLYSVIALLVAAVVYLYKQVHELNRDMRANLQTYLKEQAELTTRCTIALENSAKAVERLERLCDSLIDIKQR